MRYGLMQRAMWAAFQKSFKAAASERNYTEKRRTAAIKSSMLHSVKLICISGLAIKEHMTAHFGKSRKNRSLQEYAIR